MSSSDGLRGEGGKLSRDDTCSSTVWTMTLCPAALATPWCSWTPSPNTGWLEAASPATERGRSLRPLPEAPEQPPVPRLRSLCRTSGRPEAPQFHDVGTACSVPAFQVVGRSSPIISPLRDPCPGRPVVLVTSLSGSQTHSQRRATSGSRYAAGAGRIPGPAGYQAFLEEEAPRRLLD